MKILIAKGRLFLFFLLTGLAISFFFTPVSYAQQKGMIISLANNEVRVNWGTVDGIVQGIIFNVYREEVKVHPATGERLSVNEKLIGKIEIIESQSDFSNARIINSTESFKVGDIIKISFEDPAAFTAQIQSPDKGTIQSVDNLVATFNMGRLDGVEPNLFFDIYRREGLSTHPVTGAPIEPKRVYIGRLQVTNVENDKSMGQIIERERDIVIGDRVEFSRLQASDIELEPPGIVSVQEPVFQQRTNVVPETERIAAPDNVVGTVTKVTGRDLLLLWRSGDYGFPVGRVFGVFREVEIPHPETGVIIDKSLIQIATATLRESIGELGKAFIAAWDAEIIPGDLIGLTGGESMSGTQVITPENIEQVYEEQRSDILQQANDLKDKVNRLEAEMSSVLTALDRLNRIDRELANQNALIRQTINAVNEINTRLDREGYITGGFVLPQARAVIEEVEFPDSRIKSLNIRYSEDLNVDFKLAGNQLLVNLLVDSAGVMSLDTTQITPPQESAETPSQTGEEEGVKIGPGSTTETVPPDSSVQKSFLESVFGIFTLMNILITIFFLIVIAGALYFLVLKKKSSAGKAAHEEESADDELGDEALDDEEEEIIPDEEEIESFEDEQ